MSQSAKLISRKPLLFKMAISPLCTVSNFVKFQTTLLLIHLVVWIMRPQTIVGWKYLFISHPIYQTVFRTFIAAWSYYGARLPFILTVPSLQAFVRSGEKKREKVTHIIWRKWSRIWPHNCYFYLINHNRTLGPMQWRGHIAFSWMVM